MRALLWTLLLCNTMILFWNFTTYGAASSEMLPASHLLLVQFSRSSSSAWPESGFTGKHLKVPSPSRVAPARSKVPLPSRRPVIDVGIAPAPKPSVEKPNLNLQDREPQHVGLAPGQGIEATAAVATGDDPAWLHCSGSPGSTEDARQLRIPACTEILARSPAEPAERRRVALTLRAIAYDSLNNDRTLGDYSALLELNPDDMQVLFLRSACHARQQKYDLAVADLDRIVAAQPANARGFAERGRVYELKRDLNSAEKDYRKAAEIDSSNPEYTSNLQNIEKLRSAESETNKNKKSVMFGFDDPSYKLCANFSEPPDRRIEACSIVIARLPALEIESAFFSVEKTEDLSKSIDRISVGTCHRSDWFPQFHTEARIKVTPPIRRSPSAR